jgi:hypothetical protein
VAAESDAAPGTVVLAHAGSLVAIGERANGAVHPRKVFGP